MTDNNPAELPRTWKFWTVWSSQLGALMDSLQLSTNEFAAEVIAAVEAKDSEFHYMQDEDIRVIRPTRLLDIKNESGSLRIEIGGTLFKPGTRKNEGGLGKRWRLIASNQLALVFHADKKFTPHRVCKEIFIIINGKVLESARQILLDDYDRETKIIRLIDQQIRPGTDNRYMSVSYKFRNYWKRRGTLDHSVLQVAPYNYLRNPNAILKSSTSPLSAHTITSNPLTSPTKRLDGSPTKVALRREVSVISSETVEDVSDDKKSRKRAAENDAEIKFLEPGPVSGRVSPVKKPRKTVRFKTPTPSPPSSTISSVVNRLRSPVILLHDCMSSTTVKKNSAKKLPKSSTSNPNNKDSRSDEAKPESSAIAGGSSSNVTEHEVYEIESDSEPKTPEVAKSRDSSLPRRQKASEKEKTYTKLKDLEENLENSEPGGLFRMLRHQNVYGVVEEVLQVPPQGNNVPEEVKTYLLRISDETKSNVLVRLCTIKGKTDTILTRVGPLMKPNDIIRVHRATVQWETNRDGEKQLVISTASHLNYTVFNNESVDAPLTYSRLATHTQATTPIDEKIILNLRLFTEAKKAAGADDSRESSDDLFYDAKSNVDSSAESPDNIVEPNENDEEKEVNEFECEDENDQMVVVVEDGSAGSRSSIDSSDSDVQSIPDDQSEAPEGTEENLTTVNNLTLVDCTQQREFNIRAKIWNFLELVREDRIILRISDGTSPSLKFPSIITDEDSLISLRENCVDLIIENVSQNQNVRSIAADLIGFRAFFNGVKMKKINSKECGDTVQLIADAQVVFDQEQQVYALPVNNWQ